MFLKIIFKKLKIKESKWLEALIYGITYFFITLIIFVFAAIVLKKSSWSRDLIVSGIIGIAMFVTYLIKTEIYQLYRKK